MPPLLFASSNAVFPSKGGPEQQQQRQQQQQQQQQTKRRGTLLATLFAAAAFPKLALATSQQIELSNVRYEESACPKNQYMPAKKTSMCVKFNATATTVRKVSAANVFGFVEDVDGNSAVTNNDSGYNRVVLAQIDREIPTGESEVEFYVTVFKESSNRSKGKFKLRGFKAVEADLGTNKRFEPFSDCDLDPSSPGCGYLD